MAFLVWANTLYLADREATLAVFRSGNVTVETVPEGILMQPVANAIDLPAEPVGLIMIPGARVDPYAYLFQLSGIVEEHKVTVLITKPTLNLAFFDSRNVADLTSAAPEVERWFVGGHSLGGVRACFMADGSEIEGLVLFGSYCANDLSDSELAVLSIAGENDLLSDLDTIAGAADRLPAAARFVVVEGANHASFGDYGAQEGDGDRAISSEQMRSQLTSLLAEFVLR